MAEIRTSWCTCPPGACTTDHGPPRAPAARRQAYPPLGDLLEGETIALVVNGARRYVRVDRVERPRSPYAPAAVLHITES